MRTRFALLSVVSLLLLFVVSTVQAGTSGNLVVNGEFEEPDVSGLGGFYQMISPDDIPGWDTTDPIGIEFWTEGGAGRNDTGSDGQPGGQAIEQFANEPGDITQTIVIPDNALAGTGTFSFDAWVRGGDYNFTHIRLTGTSSGELLDVDNPPELRLPGADYTGDDPRGALNEWTPFEWTDLAVQPGEEVDIEILLPTRDDGTLGHGIHMDQVVFTVGLPEGIGPSDFDLDGAFGIGDIDLLSAQIQAATGNLAFDVDGNGSLDVEDLNSFVTGASTMNSYIGDSNGDGVFNSDDLVTVFVAGKYESGTSATWAAGDWNANGLFDSDDLVAAFVGGGYELGAKAATSAVPEPSSIMLLVLGMVGLARLRLRK
jgi:hypothetical protein